MRSAVDGTREAVADVRMKRQIRAKHTSVTDPEPLCKCGNVAVAFLQMHAIDYCTPEEPDISGLLCQACLERDVRRLLGILITGPGFCSSCYQDTGSLVEMNVRLELL